MRIIKLLASVCIMSMIMLLSSCGSKNETLRFGTMPTYSAAIYAVGIEKGFFETSGVEVSLSVFRSARDRDAAVTSGMLDGFMTDIMGAINLNDKGFPCIMTSREYEEFRVMGSVPDDSEILGEVALSEYTITEFIVDTYMNNPLNKINMLAIPDRMASVLSHEIDSGVFPQPYAHIIESKGVETMFTTTTKEFHPVVVAFDKKFISENRETIAAFYNGYSKTIDYLQTHSLEDYKSVLIEYGLASEETLLLYNLPVESYELKGVRSEDYNMISDWMINKELLINEVLYDTVTMMDFVDGY